MKNLFKAGWIVLLIGAVMTAIGVAKDGAKSIEFKGIKPVELKEDKKITKQKAFNFLQKNQGIRFLEENWEIEQTLPREQIIEDLTCICNNHIAKAKKKERRVMAS